MIWSSNLIRPHLTNFKSFQVENLSEEESVGSGGDEDYDDGEDYDDIDEENEDDLDVENKDNVDEENDEDEENEDDVDEENDEDDTGSTGVCVFFFQISLTETWQLFPSTMNNNYSNAVKTIQCSPMYDVQNTNIILKKGCKKLMFKSFVLNLLIITSGRCNPFWAKKLLKTGSLSRHNCL